jgi:hypothetical protein
MDMLGQESRKGIYSISSMYENGETSLSLMQN